MRMVEGQAALRRDFLPTRDLSLYRANGATELAEDQAMLARAIGDCKPGAHDVQVCMRAFVCSAWELHTDPHL